MNAEIRKQLARRKRRIERRLARKRSESSNRPVFAASNIRYEMGERDRGLAQGGIGAFHLLARRIGLIDRIDEKLHLLKFHFPYHESDHVLNIAYNALLRWNLPARPGTASPGRSLPRCSRRPAHSRSDHGRRLLPALSGHACTYVDRYSQRGAAGRLGPPADRVLRDGPHRHGRHPGGNGRRMQGRHRHLVRWPLGLSSAGRFAGQHRRGAAASSTDPAIGRRTRALPPRSIAPCGSAWMAASGVCSCAATPTSSQTRHLDRWTDDTVCSSSSASIARPIGIFWPTNCRKSSWQPLHRPPPYEVQTEPRARPENVKRTDRPRARVREHPPPKRGRGRDAVSPDGLPQDLSTDRRSQESVDRTWRSSALRRLPLLLLPDQRPGSSGGGDCVRRQPALQPGEPARPTQGRRASVDRGGRQPGEQLGVHGDDGPGLEPEGLVGALADRVAGALANSISATSGRCWAWSSRRS